VSLEIKTDGEFAQETPSHRREPQVDGNARCGESLCPERDLVDAPEDVTWSDVRGDNLQEQLLPEDLGKPFYMTREARSDLPPLTDETRDRLKELGVSDETIDAMANDAEGQIYLNANLEPSQVNGKEVLIRTDIDPDQVDAKGDTNLQRMQNGKAPLDKDGNPIELHHIGQKQDSALAELTPAQHRGNGNDCVLHDKNKESEIDRANFDKERQAHWKARAEQIVQDRQGESE
jgi:hypothetical protein